MKKLERVTIRLSTKERELLEQAAGSKGISSYVRSLLKIALKDK